MESRCPLHPEAELRVTIRGASDDFFGFGGSFDYKTCSECRSLVLDPRPGPDEIGHFYGRYYEADLMARLEASAARGRWTGMTGKLRARGSLRQLAKLGASIGRDTHWLDVGCGLASYARHVRDFSGARVRGVDFSPALKTFADRVQNVEVDTGELEDQNYPDASFDVVSSWHFMEHVYEPPRVLAEMARITKPGGWIVLETPAVGLLGKLFRKHWLYLQPPTHLFHYQPTTLAALVEGAGYEVKQVLRPWFPGELAGSVLLTLGIRGLMSKLFGAHRSLLVILGLGVQLPIDVPLTLLLAMSGQSGLLRIIAQKPGSAPGA